MVNKDRVYIKTRQLIVIAVIVCIAGCIGPTTKKITPDAAAVALEARKQKEIVLQEVIQHERRIFDISPAILRAALPLCADRKTQHIGILLATRDNFEKDFQEVAAAYLGLDDNLRIIHVTRSSPAEIAGIQEGDILLSVNGTAAPAGKQLNIELGRLLHKTVQQGQRPSLTISREGVQKEITLEAVAVCDYPVVMSGEANVNAYANGKSIIITRGMMNFINTDDELALVIGHELAHNVMQHIDAKRFNAMGGLLLDVLFAVFTGVNTGFTNMAANAYSQEFESEADYVGLYLVERAGYKIDNAAYFWRRMGVNHPGSIAKNHAASHPSSPERFVSIEETIKEINQKKESGAELMPDIDAAALSERTAAAENQSDSAN